MIRNFFITALRNFRKNISQTALNITGLSVGMACCLVVFTIVEFEYTFDDWHQKKDRIYRVTNIYHGDNETEYSGIIPYPSGNAIKEHVPDVEKVVEFHGPVSVKFAFKRKEEVSNLFREYNILYTNEAFFEVLDFEMLEGDENALAKPNQIILTQTLAQKYFPDKSPLGEIIKLDGAINLEVAGVVQDPPQNTNLEFKSLISINTLRQSDPDMWNNWRMTWSYTAYALIRENADVFAVNDKIDQVFDDLKYGDKEDAKMKTEVALQPLKDIHNDERYGNGNSYVSPGLLIWAFIFLGILILGTACLNFINLSTAQAVQRSKEVGIRKTLGSSKKQLITQFLMETLAIVVISMSLALNIGQFFLEKIDQALSIFDLNAEYPTEVYIFAPVLIIVVSLLAGIYPSLILSGYQPVQALKNKITIRRGSGNFNFRRALVITQFTFTSIMLIGTLIISSQVDFMKNKHLGFDYSNVFCLYTPKDSGVDPRLLLEELKVKSYISGVTLSYNSPLSNWNNFNSYKIPGQSTIDGNNANMKYIDKNFIDFYKISLIAGKNIGDYNEHDSSTNVLVTRHLLSTLGWDNPEEALGKQLHSGADQNRLKIVGVVEDFNSASVQSNIDPVILFQNPERMHQISLRLPKQDESEYMKDIEASFRKFYPNELFEYDTLKAQITNRYALEDLLFKVIRFVSFLSILLSIMGLYGLVSFMANRNAKVIGIRKVFGASTSNILNLFTREYGILMLISFLLSAPVSYYLMSIWIEEFAYRIDLSISHFLFGFGITLLVAIATVGYRSYIAAKANPINSLRYE